MYVSRWMLATVATLVAAGCQPVSSGTYITGAEGQPVPQYALGYNYQMNDVVPAAGLMPVAMSQPAPQMYQPQPAADTALANQVRADMSQLADRLQRVEKAMLRLDRRMQLVERNELNRMGGGEGMGGLSALTPQDEQVAMQSMNIGPQYSNGFRPVSSDSAITSSLQAAPGAQASGGKSYGSYNGLPSLADVSPAAGRAPDGDLSVWTVTYDGDKVWPDRDQLPLSRDVVEALRNGQGVTVFARGKHPQATEFRERVKALSRYLGKVASLESVPISAIPAPHLNDNTIEIFATH